MSVDPDQPSAPDPTTPRPPANPGGESAEALRLKRRFKRDSANEAEEGEKPDQTIQLLSTLLQDLIAKKEQPGTPEAETKTAKYHRLPKTGGGPPVPPADSSAPTADPEAASPAATVPPAAPPAAPAFRPAPALETWAENRRARRLHLLYPLAALALAAAAYYAGSSYGGRNAPSGSANKTAPAAAGTWSDAMLSQLGQALAADQAGDLKGAQRIASSLVKPDGSAPPGLTIYLAGLGSRQGRSYDVQAELQRAVVGASPEAAAQIDERMAFNFSRSREFDNAVDYFKLASRLDPFSAPIFYHWGEALRHLGHLQEAADVFRQALDRLPTGQPETESLRECINLKQRLALIEQARDGELQEELTSQLKVPQPSGYWLLTAAAVALQHKNLPEAAGYLGRARDALGAATFNELLNDYFFRAYADRQELADFFPPDPAARRAGLLPTMTYTVEP